MLNALSSSFSISRDPVGYVRRNRSYQSNHTPRAQRYYAWCDEARKAATGDASEKLDGTKYIGFFAFAHIKMPESWSAKKKLLMAGQLNMSKPDKDNLEKAIADALFSEDKGLCVGGLQAKFWAMPEEVARIDVFLVPVPVICESEPDEPDEEEEEPDSEPNDATEISPLL